MSQNEDGKYADVELSEKQQDELLFQLHILHALLYAAVEQTENKRLVISKSIQEKLANTVHPSQWHVTMKSDQGSVIITQTPLAPNAPPPVGWPDPLKGDVSQPQPANPVKSTVH